MSLQYLINVNLVICNAILLLNNFELIRGETANTNREIFPQSTVLHALSIKHDEAAQ